MIKTLLKLGMSRLSVNQRYEVFYQFAKSLGIRGYVLDGQQGVFAGAVRDRTIMRSYLCKKAWSTEIMQPLSKALADGGTFIDVGANIGLIALPIARLPGVSVIALEPDEENHAFLLANVGMHQLANVCVVNAAAWSENTSLRFTRNAFNSGDHHLSASGEYEVRALALDSLDIPAGPLVLKIDTQGAEPAVLAGAASLLERADLAVIEFWPWGMRRMGQDPQAAIDCLARYKGRSRLIESDRYGEWMDGASLRTALSNEVGLSHEHRSLDVMLCRDERLSSA